jgi:hypothetical protein
MSFNRKTLVKNIALAVGMVWLAGCTGTETTNPASNDPLGNLRGRLVDTMGQPRSGAIVKAFEAGKGPVGKVMVGDDSVITDDQGFYRFQRLGRGSYNLIGDYNGGDLVVLIPKVYYQGGNMDLGTDTLRLPGRITGNVRLEGKGKAGIFCYLIGTSFLSISDETGKFWIYGVPQGKYDLSHAYPGLQTSMDTEIAVKAGETTMRPDRDLVYDTVPSPSAAADFRETIRGNSSL